MLDTLRGPIKAGVAALFAVGVLLLLLNPPSLSGAEGMAVFIGGGLVLALLTAWGFVALTGRDAMPDDEFERLVRRSEELARQPGLPRLVAASAGGWIGLSLVLFAFQGRFYGHYAIPLAIPLALLGAAGIDRLDDLLTRTSVPSRRVMLLASRASKKRQPVAPSTP